jgi:uncharacterized protein with FMN-binding domain
LKFKANSRHVAASSLVALLTLACLGCSGSSDVPAPPADAAESPEVQNGAPEAPAEQPADAMGQAEAEVPVAEAAVAEVAVAEAAVAEVAVAELGPMASGGASAVPATAATEPQPSKRESKPAVLDTDTDTDTDTDFDLDSGGEGAGRLSLDERLAQVQIPPPWLEQVQTSYDTSQPWQEARLEIRRLLSLGQPESHREALKLTWLYLQKNDINDGHEYAMYTFLGGEPLWSILAHQWYLAQPHENMPIHSYMTLASLYAKYGEFERAKATLDQAAQGLPGPPWKIMRQADLAAEYGDLYAAWGQPEEAKRHYAQAASLYPTAKPPYGGHLLASRAADVQAKLDLLTFRSLATARLRDGQYRDKALGYAGPIQVTLTVAQGKIADIQLAHEEKIDQNACVLVPQRIVAQQSLQVDAISGATVTTHAIVNGVFRCLKKAGLQ